MPHAGPELPQDALLRLPAWLREHPHLRPLRYRLEGGGGAVRASYLAAVAKGMRLLDERNELCRVAAAARIPLMVIKGGYLIDTIYGGPGTRHVTDLDVVVPASQVASMDAILVARGYHAHNFMLRREHGLEHHVHYRRDDGMVVEVHWLLWHELGFNGDLPGLYARGRWLDDATRILGPSMSDHLMLVALHAATHSFSLGPAWLVDVALLLRHPETNVAEAAADAAARDGRVAFEVAMGIARSVWQHDAIVRERLSPPSLGRARALVAAVTAPLSEGRMEGTLKGWALKAALFDRWPPLVAALATKSWVRLLELHHPPPQF